MSDCRCNRGQHRFWLDCEYIQTDCSSPGKRSCDSMMCSSSCARSSPARPRLGLFVRSLSIRRSAAATRSRARSKSAMVYCRGFGRVRFLRGPLATLLARMAALSCFPVAIGPLRFFRRIPPIKIMAAKRFRSAFGLATLSDSPAGRHGLMNCKVFKLCAGFQLFSQPNGLRSSSCPLIACLVAIFDRGLSTFQRTSLAPLSGADFTAQPRKLALQLVGPTAEPFPMSSRSFKRDPTDIEARFALAIFISRKHPRPTASIPRA